MEGVFFWRGRFGDILVYIDIILGHTHRTFVWRLKYNYIKNYSIVFILRSLKYVSDCKLPRFKLFVLHTDPRSQFSQLSTLHLFYTCNYPTTHHHSPPSLNSRPSSSLLPPPPVPQSLTPDRIRTMHLPRTLTVTKSTSPTNSAIPSPSELQTQAKYKHVRMPSRRAAHPSTHQPS